MKIENLEDQAKHLLGEFVHVMASCEESKQLSGGNAATCHIKEELERMGLEAALFSDFGCVIGIIQGRHPGTAVALQADTNTLYQSKDALPQETETHCSDAVMLLAAAAIINKMKAELHGSVILIFQDSRKPCINFLSCYDNNKFSKPNGIFAVRLSEYIDDGLVNFQKGLRTAFCSKVRLVVHGCASHGSTPQLSKDAVVAVSAVIMAVQTYASRRNDPLNPFALTISQIKAGSQFNIIADTASMLGAAYSFSAKTHEELKATLTELTNGAAASMGCTAEIEITETKKPVVNSCAKLTETACGAAERIYGKDILCEAPPILFSDNFSAIAENIPGAYGFIGYGRKRNAEQSEISLSDTSAAYSDAISKGTVLYVLLAHDFLSGRE